ncbi:MAG: glycine cleavage system protein H [Candidatus Woesearchaeota archaeon]
MDETIFSLPEDRFYDEQYTWIILQNDVVLVGIVKPAADLVKEFVFIQLPLKGKKLKKGDVFVSVEAVKWSGHMKSPITGTVVEVNDVLFDTPSLINKNPYGSWIAKIQLQNPEELKLLLTSKERIKKPLR